jgi:hypothetical protein
MRLFTWRSRGVVALVALLALAGCSDSRSPESHGGPSTAAATSARTTADSVATPDSHHTVGRGVRASEVSTAVDTVGRAMAGMNSALAAPGDAGAVLDGHLVAGAAREALLAQAAEYADNGWTVSGAPRIVRMVVHKAAGGGLQVRACVDQSAVVVKDRDGHKLPPGSAGSRTWMIFLLGRAGDGWQVTDQTFPDDPDC